MMPKVESPSFAHLQVGAYNLTRMEDGSFWIHRQDGEGLQVGEREMENLISAYFEIYS